LHGIFERLAGTLAILGGLVVVGIMLVTTGSVLSRWAFGVPLSGDTEIVEFGMAIVVACFLPLCQWRSGNVIIDFFTSGAPLRVRDALDRFGALLIALMLGLVAWRTGAGALDQHRHGSVTMLLQWPEWIAYLLMTVPAALAAVMALYTAATGRSGAREGPPTHNPVPESASRQEP
jgi:TRAP-type C4-dicarboxylate transport system permease small subunit